MQKQLAISNSHKVTDHMMLTKRLALFGDPVCIQLYLVTLIQRHMAVCKNLIQCHLAVCKNRMCRYIFVTAPICETNLNIKYVIFLYNCIFHPFILSECTFVM